MKRTPLASEHEKLGAKMVDFAGWWMPVQYKGLKEEHLNVRQHVGLFDVSHMGEVRFKGPKALETLEWLTTNDVSKLNDGEAQYSLLPNDQGGLVDDIIVYCLKKNEDYLVCVNASNTEKDFNWMVKNNKGADITNESNQWGQIAVQGPKAFELLNRITGLQTENLKSFSVHAFKYHGGLCYLALTGYTGEKGAEIFVPADHATSLWNELLNKGQDLNVQPIGLGARDTLRTEMKYSLYGHEIDDTTNPYEAGLGWVIKPAKKTFLGQNLILPAKENPKRRLVGFKLSDKGIPRQGYKVLDSHKNEVGLVTSGTLSPSLDEAIGIAYVTSSLSSEGTEIWIDIRGRAVLAKVVATPFVKK